MPGGVSASSAAASRHGTMFRFIRRLVFQSTALILIFQFISNVFFPDHNADAFRTLISPPVSIVDDAIRLFASGMTRWDGQHYLHIAQFGYTYEHSIAFFPVYPYLVYATSLLWYPLVPSTLLSFPTALMLSGIAVNVAAFFGAAWFLYALTKNMASIGSDNEKAETTAILAVMLFVLNPANIFFRAMYTESLYAFLTFLGMNCLLWGRYQSPATGGLGQKPGRNLLESGVCFGLALTVRSNGILNLGYLLHYYAAYWLKPFFAGPGRLTTTNSFRAGRFRPFTLRRHVKELLPTIPVLGLALTSALVPFLMAQYHHFQTFCDREIARRVPISYDVAQHAAVNGYVLPGDLQRLDWCVEGEPLMTPLRSISTLPYTAVQGKYWEVGLFGYYRLRKLPLFILASPTLILAICACVHSLTSMRLSHGDVFSKMVQPQGVLPFVVHVVVLAVVGWLFINVEVITRMLFSSSPLPYWFCATLFMDQNHDSEKRSEARELLYLETAGIYQVIKYLWRKSATAGKLVLIWFVAYTIIGTAAFANYLPWT